MRCSIKILLLEDDALLAQSIIDELEDAGYHVIWASESQEVLDLTYESHYELYLFDVNVPGISGFELLGELRQSGDRTPAIFMTSRNQIDDIREGFSRGADDYIKKPFDLDELLIRIDSKLPAHSQTQLSRFFSIDPEAHSLTCKEKTLKLPAKEFKMLRYFIEYEQQVLETDDLMEVLYESTISIATFRTYIKNLKRHIEGCGVIENIKGVGYRFKLL